MSLRYPLDSVTFTQSFGANADYYKQFGQSGHNGYDLRAPVGTPVYASDDGTVAFEGKGENHSWMGKIAGICAILKHSNCHTGYAHRWKTIINNGQRVTKGQLIGFSGATGTVNGAHLHWEVFPLSPNFKNGYAGRVNPASYISTVKHATVDEIKKAYRDILERDADQGGITTYSKFPIEFVRQDLANSQEKRNLDARKALAAKQAAEQAAAEAARKAEEAKKAAQVKAAAEAAQKAEEERLKAEAELARIAEEERVAREAAEARAKEQQLIERTATPSGVPMTTAELEKLGSEDASVTATRAEATKSASLFVARVYTQYLAGQVIAEGLAGILADAIGYVASGQAIGIAALVLTGLFIFWSQFGYKLSQDAGWTWASNMKWPF